MSIEVIWDNDEQNIIRVTFAEEWTWDEWLAIDAKTAPMLNSVDHKVCYIADVSQTKRVPPGLQLDIAREILEFRHENSDMLVIVGMNPTIHKLFQVVLMALSRLRTRIEIVDTLDEAYERIRYRLLEIRRYGG